MRMLRKLVNSSSARPPVIAHSSRHARGGRGPGTRRCVRIGEIGRQVEQRLAVVAERRRERRVGGGVAQADARAQVVERAGDGQRRRREHDRPRAGVERAPEHRADVDGRRVQADVARRRGQPAHVLAPAARDQQRRDRRAAPSARRASAGELERARRERGHRVAVGVQPVGDLLEAARRARGSARAPARSPSSVGNAHARLLDAGAWRRAPGRAARRRARRWRPCRRPAAACARGASTPVSRPRSRASANSRCVEACTPKNSVATSSIWCASSKITTSYGGSTCASGQRDLQRQVGEEQVVVDDHQRRGGGAPAHRRSRSSSRSTRSAGRCASRASPRSRPTAARRRPARAGRRGRPSATTPRTRAGSDPARARRPAIAAGRARPRRRRQT